jgi:hypothetical protein
MTTMNQVEDPNYEFSDILMNATSRLLGNLDLGVDTLEFPREENIKYTTALIRCIAETSDIWFCQSSQPRTILYAILINTVHEYIVDNEKNHEKREFWAALHYEMVQEWNRICYVVLTIKDGDKIDIDEYHDKFRRDLNAGVY